MLMRLICSVYSLYFSSPEDSLPLTAGYSDGKGSRKPRYADSLKFWSARPVNLRFILVASLQSSIDPRPLWMNKSGRDQFANGTDVRTKIISCNVWYE